MKRFERNPRNMEAEVFQGIGGLLEPEKFAKSAGRSKSDIVKESINLYCSSSHFS